MKVTIEIPDTSKVMTYQVVYENDSDLGLKISSHVLDTLELEKMQVANDDRA